MIYAELLASMHKRLCLESWQYPQQTVLISRSCLHTALPSLLHHTVHSVEGLRHVAVCLAHHQHTVVAVVCGRPLNAVATLAHPILFSRCSACIDRHASAHWHCHRQHGVVWQTLQDAGNPADPLHAAVAKPAWTYMPFIPVSNTVSIQSVSGSVGALASLAHLSSLWHLYGQTCLQHRQPHVSPSCGPGA